MPGKGGERERERALRAQQCAVCHVAVADSIGRGHPSFFHSVVFFCTQPETFIPRDYSLSSPSEIPLSFHLFLSICTPVSAV